MRGFVDPFLRESMNVHGGKIGGTEALIVRGIGDKKISVVPHEVLSLTETITNEKRRQILRMVGDYHRHNGGYNYR